jgi:phosphatidylserine/phosphatidylglycerophosphate/cardiolipin synthase-like enzyme
MSGEFQVLGQNPSAQFSLKIHRGDGMAMLAMDWKNGKPPVNFVGFAIQYTDPASNQMHTLQNRLNFADTPNPKGLRMFPTTEAPIQKFRWVHFPRQAVPPGKLTYHVKPVFMDDELKLTYGAEQTADLELTRETYPGQLNVAYTRGFIYSQAFIDKYKTIAGLLPAKSAGSLDFKPSVSYAEDAHVWMGFEARAAILGVLDKAVLDETAEVRVVAYDLNEPEIVSRLEKLKSRLKVIIDDSGSHKKKGANENETAKRLIKSAGRDNVKREHMGSLQHNKFIAVAGKTKLAVCGSTNFSWRAFYVQSNNAIVFAGKPTVDLFFDAFDKYWESSKVPVFGNTTAATWRDVGLNGIDAKIAFSPHSAKNALLKSIANDMLSSTSSLLYSLAFLYETPGPVKDAITKLTKNANLFVYGIADKKVGGGLTLQKPNGNRATLYPQELTSEDTPEPFRSEPKAGTGTRMHHKFVVIDFDKPTARVYIGSYNFSKPADLENGENLLVIRDRRIAVSYAVEAMSMLDHYEFRILQLKAKTAKKKLELARPPSKRGEKAWWEEDYTDIEKIRDRQLFS